MILVLFKALVSRSVECAWCFLYDLLKALLFVNYYTSYAVPSQLMTSRQNII
jgi:hypothetical protein